MKGAAHATREQCLYDALKAIAHLFYTSEQLRRRSRALYGLEYHEALEMSYDNMQQTAKEAIKGMRRPPNTTASRKAIDQTITASSGEHD